MTSSFLKRNQTPSQLHAMSRDNYYWYLDSQEFHAHMHAPIGKIADELSDGKLVVDLGCGEGQLAEHVTSDYFGVDASLDSIAIARNRHPLKHFSVERLEEPPYWNTFLPSPASVIVLSGVLHCLISFDQYIPFIEMYREFLHPKYLIICDLQRLNTQQLDERYELTQSIELEIPLEKVEPVKRLRKIRVYRCQ